jgi:hypothetical protein
MSGNAEEARAQLLDTSLPVEARVDAARQLGSHLAPSVRDALLTVATSANEPLALLLEVGRTLAESYAQTGELIDAPLADFAGPAYLGFDERATEILKASR